MTEPAQHDIEPIRGWDAIVIDMQDNVAIALRDLTAGETVMYRRDGATQTTTVTEPIQLGHKFALADIDAGAVIRKYGEAIGVATVPVSTGAHVHVHNLASQRARNRP